MRFLLRAIVFGILTGAFLFFFPFHFFLFPILFIFLLLRIFFRPWRWRHRFHGYAPYGFGGRGHGRFGGYGPMGAGDDSFYPVTPIDGYRPARNSGNQQGSRNINIQ